MSRKLETYTSNGITQTFDVTRNIDVAAVDVQKAVEATVRVSVSSGLERPDDRVHA